MSKLATRIYGYGSGLAMPATGSGEGIRAYPYPTSAAEMATAVGYGTWSAGWLLDEAASPCSAVFGGTNMVAVNSPTFGVDGAISGSKAVRFSPENSNKHLSAGNILNVGLTDDLAMAFVLKIPASFADIHTVLGKIAAGPHYQIYVQNSVLTLQCADGTNTISAPASHAGHIGNWLVGIACLERGVGLGRIATTKAIGDAKSGFPGAVGSLTDAAANLTLGRSVASAQVDIDAFWIGVGPGAAAGLVANIAIAVENLRRYIGVSS